MLRWRFRHRHIIAPTSAASSSSAAPRPASRPYHHLNPPVSLPAQQEQSSYCITTAFRAPGLPADDMIFDKLPVSLPVALPGYDPHAEAPCLLGLPPQATASDTCMRVLCSCKLGACRGFERGPQQRAAAPGGSWGTPELTSAVATMSLTPISCRPRTASPSDANPLTGAWQAETKSLSAQVCIAWVGAGGVIVTAQAALQQTWWSENHAIRPKHGLRARALYIWTQRHTSPNQG